MIRPSVTNWHTHSPRSIITTIQMNKVSNRKRMYRFDSKYYFKWACLVSTKYRYFVWIFPLCVRNICDSKMLSFWTNEETIRFRFCSGFLSSCKWHAYNHKKEMEGQLHSEILNWRLVRHNPPGLMPPQYILQGMGLDTKWKWISLAVVSNCLGINSVGIFFKKKNLWLSLDYNLSFEQFYNLSFELEDFKQWI